MRTIVIHVVMQCLVLLFYILILGMFSVGKAWEFETYTVVGWVAFVLGLTLFISCGWLVANATIQDERK